MSFTFAVPHGMRLGGGQSSRQGETRTSYGLVSDRPTPLYSEAPAPATTLDRPVMCTLLRPRQVLWGSHSAAAEHPAPDRRPVRSSNVRVVGIGHWSL